MSRLERNCCERRFKKFRGFGSLFSTSPHQHPSPLSRAGARPRTLPMTARAIPASAFPFFHLRPFPHRSSLPTRLEDLTTDEIALSWLLLDVDTATWRKLLRIWRARREKERSSTDQTPEDPVFELLDMNWPLSEDLDLAFLHSAQLAVSRTEFRLSPLDPAAKPQTNFPVPSSPSRLQTDDDRPRSSDLHTAEKRDARFRSVDRQARARRVSAESFRSARIRLKGD